MPGRATSKVSFTLDLEDHRPSRDWELRYPSTTRDLLDFLDAHRVRATVFVVGAVAEEEPGLVREIGERGHELALHGMRHVPLVAYDPEPLRAELQAGKALLEDLGGAPVVGFRAPTFSLVRSTVWATEVLAETGFTYSSSVLPARSPLFGFPEAPAVPFRWPAGIAELPCPVVRMGGYGIPYLGGTYLRVLPWPAVRLALRGNADGAGRWLYCHPYDFDVDAPRWAVESSRFQNWLLWVNRHRMFGKVTRVLATGAAPPLREVVASDLALDEWAPGSTSRTRR
jgi:polysaccharide deacetylase family protein (PEP-CTERM system associated)